MQRKILIIGLDGGTWKIFKPMIEMGYMPNLKILVKNGASGILKSTFPPITAPAWTSFLTGVYPGKHGIFEFTNYKPGTYSTHFINGSHIFHKTLWDILSEADKKIISINVPLTYPPKPINGLLISGILTPNTDITFTYPPDLRNEVFKISGNYKIITTGKDYCLYGLNKFIDELIDTEERRIKIAKHLLQNYDWDVTMVHIHSTDVLQHNLYHILDKQHQLHNSIGIERIYEFYKKIDEGIGELLEFTPKDSLKIVMSDHGFRAVDKIVNLNAILEERGFLKINKRKKRLLYFTKMATTLLKKYDRLNINFWLLGQNRRQAISEHFASSIIDFGQTFAFALNSVADGRIFINLEGREKFGIVKKEDYDSVRDSIIGEFEKIIDPATGEKMFSALKKEDIFNNTNHLHAPDIVVIPEGPYNCSASLFFKKGVFLTKNRIRQHHTGSHEQDGIIILAGGEIKRNNIDAYIVDVMPTILWYTGLPIPQYIDGRVLTEAFNDDFVAKQPIRISHLNEKFKSETISGDSSSREIEERLKSLGYL